MGAPAARQRLRRDARRRGPAALKPLLVSAGEPAGVGPDLCVRLAANGELDDAIVLADAGLMRERADRLGLQSLRIQRLDRLPAATTGGNTSAAPGATTIAPDATSAAPDATSAAPDATSAAPDATTVASIADPVLRVWHVPLAVPCQPGRLDPRNAAAVLSCLDQAIDACLAGQAAALVTGPVQKSTIAESGVDFMGHTEYLAERCRVPLVVMMLVGGGLRVALATTHLPLQQVPAAITPALLDDVLTILCRDLRTRFGIPQPRVLVCGLNPHAGESGHLGREEIDIIAPAVARARARGELVEGPLPADTLFTPTVVDAADAVLAMYHDQGLPVLKMKSFGGGVNVTLGLPIVRTSVDHGTALDLAGTDRADPGSLREALALARQLVREPATQLAPKTAGQTARKA